MIPMCQAMLAELEQEAGTTRRVLERVPENKLSWRPHKKSMTLGQLALHTASVPGGIAKISQGDEFDASQANFGATEPKNLGEIFAALRLTGSAVFLQNIERMFFGVGLRIGPAAGLEALETVERQRGEFLFLG